MSRLLLSFYGDDFTGSTDALEQLTLAGVRTLLFIEPPTPAQLKRHKGIRAIGVAGMTRSMTPAVMERTLKPALRQLKALGARHVHYKVCSTFDSSPKVGNIGRAVDLGAAIFRAPFVPLLVAAPPLGRYCVFGNLFARYGIGSAGAIHRLDRHPAISRHPVTPMTEADLRRHLGRQTRKKIALFDWLTLSLPTKARNAALKRLLADQPDVVLFDALSNQDLARLGELLDGFGTASRPLFSVGSSGVEMALGARWGRRPRLPAPRFFTTSRPTRARQKGTQAPLLVGSGSCSPVTFGQVRWALRNGFAEVPVDAEALTSAQRRNGEMNRAIELGIKRLRSGQSVIVHTTRSGADRRIAQRLKDGPCGILGTTLGTILREILSAERVNRLCIAGGDTSSYAARSLGIQALEMVCPLTPGAPVCRAWAGGSPVDGMEMVFKGGQVGGRDYFGLVLNSEL